MATPPRVLPSPIDVMFDDTNTVQPDVVVVRHERRHFITKRGVVGAPDLVVAVISPDYASKDGVLKRHLYERFGVPEYWLVDPEERTVLILQLREGRYVEVSSQRATGTAKSTVLPALEVVLEQLFRDL